MIPGQIVTKAGFVRGVNTEASPYGLDDTEARDLLNVSPVNTRGSIRKRDGTQTFATAGSTLTSLYASLAPNFLIAAGGTILQSVSPSGTVTTIKTGLTNGARWEWVQAPAAGGNGPLYGVSDAGQQQMWDGVAAATSAWTATSGTLPSPRYLTTANNRVWAASMTTGATADPGSTVAWSDVASPRSWPAANVIMLDPNDGEQITGIANVGNTVIVAKPSKLWEIYGLDDGSNRRVGEGVGCVAHRSMAEAPEGLYFLGKDGIYRTDGSQIQRISDRIKPTIAAILVAQRGQASGAYWNGRYFLSICTSGTANNLTIEYVAATESFWLHSIAESQWAPWEPAGTSALYGAKAGSATVDKTFVAGESQDNGAPFAAYWTSPYYTFGDPVLRKRVHAITFDGSGRIAVSAAKSFARGATALADVSFSAADGLWEVADAAAWEVDDGSSWEGLASVTQSRILTPGVARAWSVQFGNTAAETFEVDSFSFTLRPRKD